MYNYNTVVLFCITWEFTFQSYAQNSFYFISIFLNNTYILIKLFLAIPVRFTILLLHTPRILYDSIKQLITIIVIYVVTICFSCQNENDSRLGIMYFVLFVLQAFRETEMYFSQYVNIYETKSNILLLLGVKKSSI